MNKTMTIVNQKLGTNSAEIETDDLLLEILLRLPLYSIQRLKTASKHWLSLIINPTFRRKRNLKLSTGLVFDSPNYFVPLYPNNNIPITIPPVRTDLKVVQSCNGLFLCRNKRVYTVNHNSVYQYHVYNPTTTTCHTLPLLNEMWASREYESLSMSLAFDPYRSFYYKAIWFTKFKYTVLRVHIYSSDTRTWKLVSKPWPYGKPLCGEMYERVYWNGAIHWMKTLMYFDIENEAFKAMPKPPNYGSDTRMIYNYLGESCGRLNYVPKYMSKSGDSCAHVYELKRDYSEWVLKYHVELDYRFDNTFVISVVHGIDEDDMLLVLFTGEGIVRYNIVSEISEKVSVSLPGVEDCHAFQYIESQYCV